jgi:hypothetical protein
MLSTQGTIEVLSPERRKRVKVRHTIIAAALAVVTLTAMLPASEGSAPVADPTPIARDSEPVPNHPKIVVKKKPRPAAVSRDRRPVAPAWAVEFGRCVIGHESANAGLYKAENPTSSASGAYQFVDNTWQHYARLAGYGSKYSRASSAPPSVQDAVFYKAVMMRDFYHWKGTHCGYGT